jgi:hypothetical protein
VQSVALIEQRIRRIPVLVSILQRLAKVLRALWLLVGLCLLSLVLAELLARLGYDLVDAASLAIHHRKPPSPTPCERVMASLTLRWESYTYWRGQPSHNALVTVGPDGRRPGWTAPGLDADAPRVTVTGGSAVWGMCVRDDETIPSSLARALAGTRTPARVENHAQIGWVTTQEYIDLLLDLRQQRVPRVAVFYDGWNDIVAGMVEGAPGGPLNETNRKQEFDLLQHPGRLRLYALPNPQNLALGRLARTLRRHLVRGAPGRSAPVWLSRFGPDTSDAKLDSVAHQVVRIYAWNMNRIEELGRTFGFHPLFYWQPDLVGKATLSPTERATLAADPLMVRFTRKVRDAVRASDQFAACRDFRDLETEFDADEQEIFFDWCHITAGANDRVAELIAADVRAALRSPAAGPTAGAVSANADVVREGAPARH